MHPATQLRGGASGHNDLRVRSLREKASERVTALFDCGGINRALDLPWAGCVLGSLLTHLSFIVFNRSSE
jgi:hypothetical protein